MPQWARADTDRSPSSPVAAATAGAAEVRSRYGRPVTRHAKEGTDFATSADLASEEAIRALLAEHRPDDAMVGEEAGRTGPSGAAASGWSTRCAAPATSPRPRHWSRSTSRCARTAGCWRRPAPTRSAARSSGPTATPPGYVATVPTLPWRRIPCRCWSTSTSTTREGGDALHLLGDATFRRDFSPRVSSSTLAMTWLAAGRRAAYVHEGDLRDNVHFAAPIAIAQAAGCVVTGIHGQPAAHGAARSARRRGRGHPRPPAWRWSRRG